jgi:nucleotide-binding universal stress UspA family protein
MATTTPDHRAAPVVLPSEPLRIQRLLCPIDLSELSANALDQAVDLARACRASITALFVFPPIPYLAGEGAVVPVPSEPDAAARSVVAKDLAEFMRPARAAGVAVDVCLRVGDPATQIVAAAAETNADAIVMATHGRSGFRRLILGSVAERVLWTATCPVITIPPGEQLTTSGGAQGPMLCALDLEASSTNTLKHALLLSRTTGRPLAFLHVLADLSQHRAAALAAHIDWAAFSSEMQRHARERLGQLIRAESAAADGAEQLLATGDPYREILRLAEERGASMIVMGVHAAGAGGALFGSTAAHVVRKAKCPVLTVRSA